MSDLCEAKLAVHSVKATGLPVVACMAFDFGADKDRTIMGHTPEQAARELAAAGADVVGANCGSGIEAYVSVCERLHSSTDRPIWIKPNAGMPQVVEGRTVYKTTPQEFARHGPALISAGATFIGGCCGTNAEFIHTLIESLKVHGLP